jgi:alcohol dehydrogenase
MAAGDYPPMLAQVADGTLRPGLLVGEVVGLEQAGPALAAVDGPHASAGMTVVIPAADGPGLVTRPSGPEVAGRPVGRRRWTAA